MSESLSQKYERILSLCDVGKRHGCYTQIRCPVSANHKHEDKEKSASLGLHSNGISFKCFAGCQTDDFLKVLGLTYRDFFADDDRTPSNIYTYHNADGTYHHDKVKYRRPNGKKDFVQRTIDENGKILWSAQGGIPYHYPDLKDTIQSGKLVLYCEGEKDCETAKILGYYATTFGGSSEWKDEWKNYFKEANLILIPDKDDSGLKETAKMIESLKVVVKSLKTMILPLGKDLTEWVEVGNFDLKPLIASATELITTKGVPEPVVKIIIGGYELYWIGLDLKIIIDHIQESETVEISVYEKEKLIYVSSYNLLSISHKDGLVRSLKKFNTKLNWDVIINQVTIQCLAKIRNSEPIIFLTAEYGKTQPKYLIAPLFIENNVNIIYAERSSAKSLFMTFIDIMLSMGWADEGIGLSIPQSHSVLFLDWENDPYITGWIKQCLLKGMELGSEALDLAYAHCSKPLVKCLPQIQQKINDVKADVIIVDSLGVAVGGNLNDSEPALEFFSAIRQLPVTPLVIAQTSKDKNTKSKSVYGNALYEYLSRSVWELSKKQQYNTPELFLSMYQRKSPPFVGSHSPIGFRFSFDGDKTYVESCQPENDEREG